MNFLKPFRNYFRRGDDDRLLRSYRGSPDVTGVEGGQVTISEAKMEALFNKHPKESWVYFLTLEPGKGKPWNFPISPSWKVTCSLDNETGRQTYKIHLGESQILILKFPSKKNNEQGGRFGFILSRLMYQTKAKDWHIDCPNQGEIDALIIFEDAQPEDKCHSQEIRSVFDDLAKQKHLEFAVVCPFWIYKDTTPSGQNLEPALADSILAVFDKGNFNSQLEVFDKSGNTVKQSRISRSFSTYFDGLEGMFHWRDPQSNGGECYAVKMSPDVLRQLEYLLVQLNKENEVKRTYNDFITNVDQEWEDTYGRGAMEIEDSEDLPPNNYKLNVSMNWNESMIGAPVDETVTTKNKHLIQTRHSGQVMASRDSLLDVYQFDSTGDQYRLLGTGKISGDPSHANPSKIEYLDDQSQLLFMDRSAPSSVFLSDPHKGAIVREFLPIKGKKICDFGVAGGKNGQLNGSNLIVGISPQEIVLMDRRDPKGVVKAKPYKTTQHFTKLVTVRDESFAVASQDGVLRTYDKVGSNAKNKIPSHLNDSYPSLDSSVDGKMLLANCGSYLLLFEDENMFTKTLRIGEKPTPKILTVHPQAMNRLKLMELKFTEAKFGQQQNGREQVIVAYSEDLIAVWTMAQVDRGELATEDIKKVDNKVVGAGFRFNTDHLVVAYADGIGWQRKAGGH